MYSVPKKFLENFLSVKKNEHAKARAKGSDFITNVISASQHYTSTFSDADIWQYLTQAKEEKIFYYLGLEPHFHAHSRARIGWYCTNMQINLIGSCNN